MDQFVLSQEVNEKSKNDTTQAPNGISPTKRSQLAKPDSGSQRSIFSAERSRPSQKLSFSPEVDKDDGQASFSVGKYDFILGDNSKRDIHYSNSREKDSKNPYRCRTVSEKMKLMTTKNLTSSNFDSRGLDEPSKKKIEEVEADREQDDLPWELV